MKWTSSFKLRDFLPPILLKIYQARFYKYGFWGDYRSWQAAYQDSTGYDKSIILDKVRDALLRVKQGTAVYERDSVIFDQIHYSFPLLAGLLRISVQNKSQISVLDFGGSLGSSYYQCRNFLSSLSKLEWSIVEQQNFVDCGREFFEDDQLKFFSDIDTCLLQRNPHVILLSGVLQYLEFPYKFLENMVECSFEHIIIDRTSFLEEERDRLAIQKVPPEIYPASYPAWFLNLDKFLDIFREKYELIAQFDALAGLIELRKPYAKAQDMGFIFKLKDES
jgi:putative methyltransferase (TIGR04325 family)